MPAGGLIAIGAGSIGASIIGGITAGSQQAAAQAAMQNAVNQIQQVGAPPDIARQIMLQNFQQAGVLTPEMEQNITSQFQQLQTNPQQFVGQAAQTQALQKLTQASAGGLTPQDRANLAQIQQQAQGAAQSAQQSIIQNAQQRGQAGGGTELAAQLSAAQGGANQQMNSGLQVGAQAGNQALAATNALGQLGGQVEQQAYGQSAQQQQLAQAIQNFNTQNALGVQQANVGAQNQAQAANLAVAQGVSNANVQQANAEQQREVAAQQQQYQDALAKAQAAASAYTGTAQQANTQAQQTGNMYGNIGQGIASVGSAYATANKPAAGTTYNFGTTGAVNPSSGIGPVASGEQYGAMLEYKGGTIPGYADGGQVQQTQALPQSGNKVAQIGVPPVASGAMGPMMAAIGGKVPGRAKVPGNSPKNDTINARLSPGEVVIPRNIVHDPDAVKKFVEKENTKNIHSRLSALEKLCMGGTKE